MLLLFYVRFYEETKNLISQKFMLNFLKIICLRTCGLFLLSHSLENKRLLKMSVPAYYQINHKVAYVSINCFHFQCGYITILRMHIKYPTLTSITYVMGCSFHCMQMTIRDNFGCNKLPTCLQTPTLLTCSDLILISRYRM